MEKLLELLVDYEGLNVFNQYRDIDLGLDRPNGAAIRCQNLRLYLEMFAGASYGLIGEAAGYAGCRFSGIPFTSEVQIAGRNCLPWAQNAGFSQSSLGDLWKERSAGIVWEVLKNRQDCVLWNVFPWHPHGSDPLSNRKPRRSELHQAHKVLSCFLDSFKNVQFYAIGRVSQSVLETMGVNSCYIRHPSYGGKSAFILALSNLQQGFLSSHQEISGRQFRTPNFCRATDDAS